MTDEIWNDTTLRWRLAKISGEGQSPVSKRIRGMVLDMRLMQEPIPSLLKLITRELGSCPSEETRVFLQKIQEFVFHPDFPVQYSSAFIHFLRENVYLMNHEPS